jgi:hypothetical protein
MCCKIRLPGFASFYCIDNHISIQEARSAEPFHSCSYRYRLVQLGFGSGARPTSWFDAEMTRKELKEYSPDHLPFCSLSRSEFAKHAERLMANRPSVRAIPPEYQCPLCSNLFRDAVLIPCCQESFCDQCKLLSVQRCVPLYGFMSCFCNLFIET